MTIGSWQRIAGLGQLEIGFFSKAKASDNKIFNKWTGECASPFLGISGDGTDELNMEGGVENIGI